MKSLRELLGLADVGDDATITVSAKSLKAVADRLDAITAAFVEGEEAEAAFKREQARLIAEGEPTLQQVITSIYARMEKLEAAAASGASVSLIESGLKPDTPDSAARAQAVEQLISLFRVICLRWKMMPLSRMTREQVEAHGQHIERVSEVFEEAIDRLEAAPLRARTITRDENGWITGIHIFEDGRKVESRRIERDVRGLIVAVVKEPEPEPEEA